MKKKKALKPRKPAYSQPVYRLGRHGLVERKVTHIINENDFADFLMKHGSIRLEGVGFFEVIVKKPYMGHSLAEKKRMLIDGGVRISFRPTNALKKTLKENYK